MKRHSNLDTGEIRVALLARLPGIAVEHMGKPSIAKGQTWRWRGKGAFAMEMSGPKTGIWYDHEADTGGDLIDLVALNRGIDRRANFHEALEACADYLGWSDAHVPPRLNGAANEVEHHRQELADREKIHEDAQKAELAALLFEEAVPVLGTPAEAYLMNRGLSPDVDPRALRYHERAPYHGLLSDSTHRHRALVAGAYTARCKVGSVGVVFLTEDGQKLPAEAGDGKRTFAPYRGLGCPVVWPEAEQPTFIGEGVENVLTCCQAVPGFGGIVVLSNNNLKIQLIRPGRKVILLSDGDPADTPAAQNLLAAAAWYRNQGHPVVLAYPPRLPGHRKTDWNDILQYGGGGDAVREALHAIINATPLPAAA